MAFSFSTMSSLLSLAPSGVFQRSLLPIEPVCSYHTFSPLPCYGGLFSVALSLGLPPPGITWHCILVEPGLSSVLFFNKTATARPTLGGDCTAYRLINPECSPFYCFYLLDANNAFLFCCFNFK